MHVCQWLAMDRGCGCCKQFYVGALISTGQSTSPTANCAEFEKLVTQDSLRRIYFSYGQVSVSPFKKLFYWFSSLF